MKPLLLSAMLMAALPAAAQQAGQAELNHNLKQLRKSGSAFDWEALSQAVDTSATLDAAHLAGTWKAYTGLFNFDGAINSMNLFKPFVIRIIGRTISRSEDAAFVPFELSTNKLTVNETAEQGFVNILTNKLLVVSWKSGSNYTRYYYERIE